MEKNKRHDEKPKRRFKKDRDGEFILENYATKETAVLAEARAGMRMRHPRPLLVEKKA